jgi:glutathione S-transferase
MTALVVHGIGTSRTFRVHWALAELGLPYQTVPVVTRTADTESAQFGTLNPRRKIPVLVDGALVVAESPAIVTYLGEKYRDGETILVPGSVDERARYHEWMSFICMELDATSLYVLRRHADLTEIYGAAPAAVSAASEYFARMIAAAADLYADDAPFLLGNQFSSVDIVMMTCLDWAARYQEPIPTVFEDFRQRLATRAGYQQAIAANRKQEPLQ